MNYLLKHKITKISQNKSVVLLLLACWLFMANVAFVHAQQHYASNVYDQEHTATPDSQCQLCASSFNTTPFINYSFFNIEISLQSIVGNNALEPTIGYFTLLSLSNRGPPQRISL
jgi:hypothetical protein